MSSLNCACRIALLVALASLPLRAQQTGGRVRVSGQISGVAAAAAGPAARVSKGGARVSTAGSGVRGLVFTLSGTRGGETQIELPVQLRSNAGFALSASCATERATLSSLSIAEVRGAGALVYPGAAMRVEVAPAFDARAGTRAPSGAAPDLSPRATVLTGPPISTGGTLDSPENMIEVVLRIVINAPSDEVGWLVELKVSAAARLPAQ